MTQQPRPRTQITDPTGLAVAANVRRVREQRGLSTYDLSRILGKANRPIAPSALAKVERAERRVDAGDLTALAAALGVSPAALLLPLRDDRDATVEITGAGEVPADVVWSWASNERPLQLPEGDARTAMLEYQLYSLPPGRRSMGGAFVRGERTPSQLHAKRDLFERMASWGAVDLDAEKRRDPEPWEEDNG